MGGSLSVCMSMHVLPMSAWGFRPSAPVSPTIGAVYEWLYCPVSVPEQKTEEGLNQVPGHWPAAAQPLQSTNYTVHYVRATEKMSF